MTPERRPPCGEDTLATTLRHLAQRAHRVLRQGPAGGRDEVQGLLDEVDSSRGLLHCNANREVAAWLDRLEHQLAELFDAIDSPITAHNAISACSGAGAA